MGRRTAIAEALARRGVKVVEHPGWRERGSTDFTPRGVVVHHTGPGSTTTLIRLCIEGRPDLAGPLCQVVLAPDGVAHVIAAGRANHAGPGGWKGLSGNSTVFGIEAVHSGSATQPWPASQLEAYYRCCAGLLDLIGSKNAGYVAGHKEWAPTRKIDPVSLDMNQFRARVQAILDGGEEDEVALVDSMADQTIGGKAAWSLLEDGTIRNFYGARHLGEPKGKDYWGSRRADHLEANDRGGYDVLSTEGGRYSYPIS